jgi:hypothetical protein
MDPLLGILSFGSSGKLEIWDWTTCQKITVWKTPTISSTIIRYLPVFCGLESPDAGVHGSARLAHRETPFQAPLSCFCRSATYPNPLAISWDAWSKDVYFLKEDGVGHPCEISGGRFVGLIDSSDPHCPVSLSDLNRFRADAPGTTSPGLSIDDDLLLHVIESHIFPFGQLRVEYPDPVHVASRSWGKTSLTGSGVMRSTSSFGLCALIFISVFLPWCGGDFIGWPHNSSILRDPGPGSGVQES